ncbi:uncharacterized protein LOC129614926 isoform X2 [Condylostylus longicornis]|uniref:uncharacterized protein LOC129614926 isoform X2 n=1 Tax=Condylostylus longicornis TaxID=2530218 RepID=UPI00244E28F4|nr:uncharacterized protein LOC129614926 isoform X2 [Condylostylus longicornis]
MYLTPSLLRVETDMISMELQPSVHIQHSNHHGTNLTTLQAQHHHAGLIGHHHHQHHQLTTAIGAVDEKSKNIKMESYTNAGLVTAEWINVNGSQSAEDSHSSQGSISGDSKY